MIKSKRRVACRPRPAKVVAVLSLIALANIQTHGWQNDEPASVWDTYSGHPAPPSAPKLRDPLWDARLSVGG